MRVRQGANGPHHRPPVLRVVDQLEAADPRRPRDQAGGRGAFVADHRVALRRPARGVVDRPGRRHGHLEAVEPDRLAGRGRDHAAARRTATDGRLRSPWLQGADEEDERAERDQRGDRDRAEPPTSTPPAGDPSDRGRIRRGPRPVPADRTIEKVVHVLTHRCLPPDAEAPVARDAAVREPTRPRSQEGMPPPKAGTPTSRRARPLVAARSAARRRPA